MITSDELKKISEFRSLLPPNLLRKDLYEDDYYLIRWLRARQMDVEKAFEMLKKSLKWREEMGADGILDKEDVPEKYRKVFPTALLGRDDEDCVVVLLPLGRFEHRFLLENEKIETAVKYNMIWMEKMMRLVKEAEEETGKKGLRIVEVVDMEHYSYKELTYGPAREFILRTNKNFDDNYPEMLKTCLVINAPKVFALLFSFVKPFMSKETISKVCVYGGGTDEETWKEYIRKRFKPELVPRRWGGTRKGADEFCSDDPEIWMDAPIPLSFFTNEPSFPNQTTERIKPRDKFQIDIPVTMDQEGCPELQWKFRVESHDIGFSVTFRNDSNNNEEIVIVPGKRVDAKAGVQEGSHTHSSRQEGVFTVAFDNKYSLARSKTVHFSLQLVYVQDLQN